MFLMCPDEQDIVPDLESLSLVETRNISLYLHKGVDACLSRGKYRVLMGMYKEAPDPEGVSQGELLKEGKLFITSVPLF